MLFGLAVMFVWTIVTCTDECWEISLDSTVCVLFDLRADQRASHHGLDVTDTLQHQLQHLSWTVEQQY